MTDKELLELSAKAAGMNDYAWNDYWKEMVLYIHDVEHPEAEKYFCRTRSTPGWNPLTDDGDALRLAVKLEFKIDPCDNDIFVQKGRICEVERGTQDPYAATRRAIVRAAAEIGRNMK